MAKPDCDDGWHKIAYELEAAICFADFSKLALTILRYGFAQIYGKGTRPTVMHLQQVVIATRVGQDRQSVYRAVEELVGSGVLIKVKDDHYRFVKNYERWKSWSRSPAGRGKDRLSPLEIADCKNAPTYAKDFDGDHIEDPRVVHPADTYEAIEFERVVHPADELSAIRLTPITDTNTSVSSIRLTTNPFDSNDLCKRTNEGTGFALNSNTEKREKEQINSRACEDDFEPFMSPPPAIPIPASIDPSEKPLLDYMLRVTATADYPAGREDMADHVIAEFRSWVGQGYGVAVVKSAIYKTAKKGGRLLSDPMNFSRYAQAILNGYAADRADIASAPPAVLPSQTKLKKYLEPIEVPDHLKRTMTDPKGQR